MKTLIKNKYEDYNYCVIHVSNKPQLGARVACTTFAVLVEEPDDNDSNVFTYGWITMTHHKKPQIEYCHEEYESSSTHEVSYIFCLYKEIIEELKDLGYGVSR